MAIALQEDWASVIADKLAQRRDELPEGTVSLSVTGTADGDLTAAWSIKDGVLSSADVESADVVLTADAKGADAIVRGNAEIPVAFMRGQLKASGDPAKAMQLLKAAAPRA